MKNFPLRRCFLYLVAFLFALINSCTKSSDKDENAYVLFGNASGSQEVPQVGTQATASLDGTFNIDNHSLEYIVSWSGLSGNVTAINFHGPAGVGGTAEVLVKLPVHINSATGKASGSIVAGDLVTDDLLNGNIYYNISTLNYPNGEIRGQVIAMRE